MKWNPVQRIFLASSVSFLLVACGGSEGGAPGGAVSSIAASTPADDPFGAGAAPSSELASAGAAPTPKAGPPVRMQPAYPDTELVGARGDPYYWKRRYLLRFGNGKMEIGALPADASAPEREEVPARIELWWTGPIDEVQHQDAATFGSRTIDGRRAWLTVHRDGRILGAGFHRDRDDKDSYLRLGNLEQDGPFDAPQVRRMTCWNEAREGVPVSRSPYTVTAHLDRRDYPYASIRVENDDGRPSPFESDADDGVRGWTAMTLDGDHALVTVGYGFPPNTTYRIGDGRLLSLRHQGRHYGAYCQ